MKKAIRIHISGYIFNIDEDAYSVLEKWLNSISKQYENEEDGDEIFKDIEMRVAELFNDKVGSEGGVSIKEVNSVIQTMGQPEEFEEEQEQEQKHTRKTENIFSEEEKHRKQKRLYRDEDDNVIAGVCSGLGNYFGVDPVLVRLLFLIALFAGFGTVLYIVLWIVIPKAETVSQKLEMMGEPVNISNIEKVIKEEFEYVKEKFANKKKRRRKRRP